MEYFTQVCFMPVSLVNAVLPFVNLVTTQQVCRVCCVPALRIQQGTHRSRLCSHGADVRVETENKQLQIVVSAVGRNKTEQEREFVRSLETASLRPAHREGRSKQVLRARNEGARYVATCVKVS